MISQNVAIDDLTVHNRLMNTLAFLRMSILYVTVSKKFILFFQKINTFSFITILWKKEV